MLGVELASDLKISTIFLASRNLIVTTVHGSCWSSFSVTKGSASLQGVAFAEFQLKCLAMSFVPWQHLKRVFMVIAAVNTKLFTLDKVSEKKSFSSTTMAMPIGGKSPTQAIQKSVGYFEQIL